MRLIARTMFAAASLIALAACGKDGKGSEPAPAGPTVAVNEVAAADGYGTSGAGVNAVAFWSHPSVNFESLLLAATDAGLEAFNIETGERAAAASGAAADRLVVFYDGDGAAAAGYAAARQNGAYAFYAISNEAPSLNPVAVENAALAADTFCIGGGALYEAGETGLAARALTISSNSIRLEAARPIADLGAVKSCHVDDRSGEVIVISADGGIRRVDPQSGESFGLAFGPANATASALFLMTTPEPENAAGGAIAMLDGDSGVVTLYDLADGHAMGAVRIKATFDLDAIASASTIAAGYGNYGGVYRDGALAVVTKGDGAPIRLAPWNGVLDAIGQPLGENVDPRAPQAATDADPVISIELIEP